MAKPKKVLIVSIAIIIAIAVIAVSLMLFYAGTVRKVLNDETTLYLQEITQQESVIIESQVNGDLSTLEAVAFSLESTDLAASDLPSTMELLNKIKDQNGFKRMGLIAPDGTATTTDGHTEDFSDRGYFRKALSGVPNISNTFSDAFGGQSINVYAVPLFSGRQIIYVLFATQSTEVFEDKISVSTFNGNGYSYVVQRDGTKIARSRHENSVTFENFFDLDGNLLQDIDDSFEVMRTNMQEGNSGVAKYYKNGVLYYMSYAPVDVNDWYVLSIVPASVVAEKSTYLISFTSIITAVIVSTVVLLLIYIVITQSKTQKRLERIAFVDDLTGSASWLKFRDDCKDTLQAHSDQKYAFISFDINKFKIFNQLYGYNNGNLLLQHIASVLRQDMRESELYSHTGSDEFNALISYTTDQTIVDRIENWNRLIKEFGFIKKKNYNLMFSYGIYKIPADDYYITRMSDWSKTAKNNIKNNPHIDYAFYDADMNQEMLLEKQIENDMEKALKDHEFVVYYQPKFDLQTERPVAAEALIRWISPEKGFLSPGAFIPIFEKNGFIVRLDSYVFEQVCKTLRGWIDGGLPVIPISVNFSRLNIYRENFVADLLETTQKYDISTSLLEIELTESALISDNELILSRMNELRNAGFRISIDDFGTGYSSLNLLRSLPVDVIKIDKTFFTERFDDDREKIIISSILDMAIMLGMTVVAEGIETQVQAKFLKEIGYTILIQGFLYAKPMPEDELVSLLRKYPPLPQDLEEES